MSARFLTHTLVRHQVDMSCLLGKQAKLPGKQNMFALFWIGAALDQYWYSISCLLSLLSYITIITTCVVIIIFICIFGKSIILPLITCGHYCTLC